MSVKEMQDTDVLIKMRFCENKEQFVKKNGWFVQEIHGKYVTLDGD